MTTLRQQQDALGFVHLVKRHFDRASISLPREVWERMNAILAGEKEEALKVSQQSNPATLREAAAEAQAINYEIAVGLLRKGILATKGKARTAWVDDVRQFLGYMEHVDKVAAALAASGTEAALTKRIIVTHPSQMSAEALDAGAIGEYVDVPAQAAASPEGEGREAQCDVDGCSNDAKHELLLADYCMSVCDAHKAEADSRTGAFALRQSAAPSGVDLDTPSGGGNYGDRIKEIVADWKSQIAMRADPRDYYQSGVRRGLAMAVSDVEGLIDAVVMTDEAPQQLQGESKTGAVTETK